MSSQEHPQEPSPSPRNLTSYVTKSSRNVKRKNRDTQRTVVRAKEAIRKLNSAWGSDKWKPSDRFIVNEDGKQLERPCIIKWTDLSYLQRITNVAVMCRMSLPGLWASGGVLYDAMASKPGAVRWAGTTAKLAWNLMVERHPAAVEMVQKRGSVPPSVDENDDFVVDLDVVAGQGGDEVGAGNGIADENAENEEVDLVMDADEFRAASDVADEDAGYDEDPEAGRHDHHSMNANDFDDSLLKPASAAPAISGTKRRKSSSADRDAAKADHLALTNPTGLAHTARVLEASLGEYFEDSRCETTEVLRQRLNTLKDAARRATVKLQETNDASAAASAAFSTAKSRLDLATTNYEAINQWIDNIFSAPQPEVLPADDENARTYVTTIITTCQLQKDVMLQKYELCKEQCTAAEKTHRTRKAEYKAAREAEKLLREEIAELRPQLQLAESLEALLGRLQNTFRR